MKMSPLVGHKISGNGDMLAFAYNSDEEVNGVGREDQHGDACGPTITGCIDMRDQKDTPNVRDAYTIQEGAIPEALSPIIHTLMDTQPLKVHPKVSSMLRRWVSWSKSAALGPYAKGSALNRTLTYLVMSHDNNEGTMRLRNNSPALDFTGVERPEHVNRIDAVLRRAAHAIGGTLVKAPWVTVHPLGGAKMSADGTGWAGAVNHLGQLFTGLGDDVYGGIVCIDASIIPTSLG
jgi:hypothetical protein